MPWTPWSWVLILGSVLGGLAALVYFWLGRPQLVQLKYRWPNRGSLRWEMWSGRCQFRGQIKITRLRRTDDGFQIDAHIKGEWRFPGPVRSSLKRSVNLTLPWAPQEKESGAKANSLPAVARGVEIRRLRWHTAVGADDAALTAWLVGAAWQSKTALLAWLGSSGWSLATPPRLTVEPRFNALAFTTAFDCIMAVPFRNIIEAARTSAFPGAGQRTKGVKSWSTPSKA